MIKDEQIKNLKNEILNKEKFGHFNQSNEQEDNNSPPEKKKRGRNSKKNKFCHDCNSNSNGKLLSCYTCKKLKCKSCAEKDLQNPNKKRDKSSYICPNCIANQTDKVR